VSDRVAPVKKPKSVFSLSSIVWKAEDVELACSHHLDYSKDDVEEYELPGTEYLHSRLDCVCESCGKSAETERSVEDCNVCIDCKIICICKSCDQKICDWCEGRWVTCYDCDKFVKMTKRLNKLVDAYSRALEIKGVQSSIFSRCTDCIPEIFKKYIKPSNNDDAFVHQRENDLGDDYQTFEEQAEEFEECDSIKAEEKEKATLRARLLEEAAATAEKRKRVDSKEVSFDSEKFAKPAPKKKARKEE